MAVILDDYFAFETGDGSTLNEDRWGEIFSWMRTTGILSTNVPLDTSGDFAVNPATIPIGTQVQVENGEVLINGYYGKLSSGPSVIDITENSSGETRIDVVALQLDKTNDNISIVVEEGTPAVSPVAPDLIQTSTVWQIALANITVADEATEIYAGDITDERTRSVQGDTGSTAVTLTSAGGDETLVADENAPPDLQIKGLTAGSGISLSASSTDVTIANTINSTCIVRNSVDVPYTASTGGYLAWDTEEYDPSGMHDTVTNNDRINVLESGVYEVKSGLVTTASASATGFIFMTLYWYKSSDDSNNIISRAMMYPNNSSFASMEASRLISVSAGDYFRAYFYNLSSITITISYATPNNYASFFSVIKQSTN
jgi:hypothetical protein